MSFSLCFFQGMDKTLSSSRTSGNVTPKTPWKKSLIGFGRGQCAKGMCTV